MMIDSILPQEGTYSVPTPAGWLKTSLPTAATMAAAVIFSACWAPAAHATATQSTARGGGLLSYGTTGLGLQADLPGAQVAMDQNVQTFLQAHTSADLGAIAQIHALASNGFAMAPGFRPAIQFRMEQEPEGPMLFISVDTHGMEFEEQMRREMVMREAIINDERLAAAKNYVVINVY